jgi:hypothetical protein
MSGQIKVREISPFFIIWIFINKNCFMKQIFEILQEERDRILNIHESATKNQYLNTLIVEEKEVQILTEGEYVTKQFNTFGTTLKNGVAAIAKGVKFEPSKKSVGYLIANPKTIYRGNGVGNWDKDPGETVQYNCSAGKFRIGKGEMNLYNTALSKGLSSLCAEAMNKNNTQPAATNPAETPKPGEEATAKKTYTTVNKQIANSCKSGKYIDFEPGTKFIYNDAKKMASFRMFKTNNKIWGWFSCKDNTFNHDKTLYGCKNDPFAKVLQSKLCNSGGDKKEAQTQFGTDSPGLGKSGGSVVTKPNDTALDTILQKISGAATQKPGEVKQAPQTWEG